MFRKYYKAANDEIKTNRELIDKIFDEYAKTEKKKDRDMLHRFGSRYGTAFAAVLVVCMVLAVYPQITKLNEEPIVTEQPNQVNVTETKILPEIKSADNIENESVISNNTTSNVQDLNSEKKKSENTEVSSARIVEPQQDTINSDNEVNVSTGKPETNNEIRLSTNTYEDRTGKSINSYEIDISTMQPVTNEEIRCAVNILEEKLGKSDKDTGNIFIYEIVGRIETEENSYYLGRWRWLVDDHSSLLCDFVMSDDLRGVYECTFNDDKVNWNTDANMFD